MDWRVEFVPMSSVTSFGDRSIKDRVRFAEGFVGKLIVWAIVAGVDGVCFSSSLHKHPT